MAETTDYADLVALQAALEAIADDPGGWSTHAVRGVTERAASAISALVRERDHWKAEAEAHPIVRMYRGDFSYVELEVGDGDRRGFVPGSDKACLSRADDKGET